MLNLNGTLGVFNISLAQKESHIQYLAVLLII
jgi:hypothetical protein